ncbi:MAG: NAD(+)/NADH kinase [Candidatus Riflebacteria bacterium]|nr:NAD(+)/NADH kinase [Candidatus Riflebacteria bacterium]
MSPREARTPRVPRKVGLVFYVHNRLASKLTGSILRWLEQRGVEVLLEADCGKLLHRKVTLVPMAELVHQIDLLLAVGGDGTLLNAARHAARSGVPLLGINRGTVGFLTALSPRQVYAGLQRVLAGEYRVEPRMMLDVKILRDKKTLASYLALNDAVVKREISRILHYDLALNGVHLDSFPGDGVIVSTPTGSTAYSLAAGGPIIKPDVHVLLICPICPHRFWGRSLVASAADVLDVTFRSHTAAPADDTVSTEGLCLTVDGQTTWHLRAQDTVRICRSRRYTHLVRFPDSDFFQVLRTKLG